MWMPTKNWHRSINISVTSSWTFLFIFAFFGCDKLDWSGVCEQDEQEVLVSLLQLWCREIRPGWSSLARYCWINDWAKCAWLQRTKPAAAWEMNVAGKHQPDLLERPASLLVPTWVRRTQPSSNHASDEKKCPLSLFQRACCPTKRLVCFNNRSVQIKS